MASFRTFCIGKDLKCSATTPSLTEIYVKSADATIKGEEIDVTESGGTGWTDTITGCLDMELKLTIQVRGDATPLISFQPGTEFEGLILSFDRTGTHKFTMTNAMLMDVTPKAEVKAGVWTFDARFKNRGSVTWIS